MTQVTWVRLLLTPDVPLASRRVAPHVRPPRAMHCLTPHSLEAKFVDWNPLFSTQATAPSDVKLCGPLDAVYSNGQFLAPTLAGQTITAPHYIAQMGCNTAGTTCAFGWWFTIEQQPPTGTEMIVYGRHTFTFIDNGDNTTTVESYERAAGTHVAKNSVPWSIALQESLLQAATGIVCLERVYQETGSLADDAVANACTKFLP